MPHVVEFPLADLKRCLKYCHTMMKYKARCHFLARQPGVPLEKRFADLDLYAEGIALGITLGANPRSVYGRKWGWQMTCIRIPNGIICVNQRGRVRIGNRYVWIDYHPYCGPSFWWDSAMTKEYKPKDESDPIWPEFERWRLKKREAQKAKSKSRRGQDGAA